MSSMFKQPKPPEAPKPVELPQANDPEVRLGKRRQAQDDEKKRKGRSSTNLLGTGGAYSRKSLG